MNLLGINTTDDSVVPRINIGFANGGTHLITMAEGQILRVWDIKSGKIVRTIRTGLPEKRNASGHINNNLVLSGNGAYAFSYNTDGFASATLWEVGTGKVISRYNIDFPAEDHIFVAIADDGSAVYLRLRDGLYHLSGKKR